ncbi:MAG: HAMP domain-containing sensor histidine kinase [Legionellales bacterium]|jgi:signal transduction histidine kinase
MEKIYLKIYQALQLLAADEEYQFITVGILAAIGFPAFYFIWHNFPGDPYENLPLRLIAASAGLLLTFKNYWPKKLKPILPVYWYIFLLYIMPFFFTFMLLKNDASVTWQLNTLLAFILLMIVVSWTMFTILSIIGVTLAVTFYLYTTPVPVYNDNFTVTVINIISMLICCVFILRKKDKIQKERFETLQSFGSTLAHELRTPLNAIQSSMEGIKAYLPSLIKSYQQAKEAHLKVDHIRHDQMEILENAIDNVETETSLANITINMLLTTVKQSQLKASEITVFSAKQLIDQALIRYPMQTDQRSLIHVNNDHDFMIQGDKELLSHLFFNLLKNALYYLEAARKGEILIWFNSDEKYNYIYFKDTGQGISDKDLPHIFEKFYTRRYHGTGIGLAFCKSVMKLHKGKIACRSTFGEYAEFIMAFPKIT